MRELDRIDCEILEALQKNARLPNKELARRVGVAPSTCLQRVRRLYEDKVLRGFHAELDPASVGVVIQAMVAVRLNRHSLELVETFREHVLGLREVVSLYHTAGANDYLVHVAVRSSDHLRDLVLASFTTRPEVAHVETSLIFERVLSDELPIYGSAGD
jgi:DNA-binding Lrp family transcriptional regulator